MFSDGELKKLKENTPKEDGLGMLPMLSHQMRTLLARLECAEKVVDLARIKRECGDMLGETDTIYYAEEAWRKSAGK